MDDEWLQEVFIKLNITDKEPIPLHDMLILIFIQQINDTLFKMMSESSLASFEKLKILRVYLDVFESKLVRRLQIDETEPPKGIM
jgi:hypothetical protein